MRTLVLGASGLVGSNVFAAATEPVGTYHTTEPELDGDLRHLDITDADAVESTIVATEPSAVVNCAAMADVDECERRAAAARAVNATAVETLGQATAEAGADFVHISTDYVFDGRAEEPYTESAAPNPIQTYGETKLAGEQAAFETHPSPIVVRPSFVYGIRPATGDLDGFPRWVAGQLRDSGQVPLFTDQRVTPTRAGQLAETILALIRTDASGLYHVAARDCVTPYEFGQKVAAALGADESRLTEGSRADVDRAAARPRDTCLDVTAVEETLGRPQPSVAADIDTVFGD